VNAFVADFVGSTNFLDGAVLGAEGGDNRYKVRTKIGDVEVLATEALRAEDKVLVSVRPEDVELSETKPRPPPTCGRDASTRRCSWGRSSTSR
jgi:iron(III) transport system ATP-binding protein